MTERPDGAPDSRRYPWMLMVIATAPVCLGLLLVAAHRDVARSAPSPPAGTGSEWAVVQEYLDQRSAWRERTRGISVAGLTAEERNLRFLDAFNERPDIRPAIAAATAIVDAGGAHDRTTEAAEFLVMQTFTEPDAHRHMYKGARVLIDRSPHDERWPAMLTQMDARRHYLSDGGSSAPDVDRLFEELAADAENPVLRATARYYLAAGLMRSANGEMLGEEGRDGRRQRALEAAAGLSAGVEDQPFGGAGAAPVGGAEIPPGGAGAPPVSFPSGNPFGRSAERTFAEAEADLIRAIEHATVGGTALDMTGRRLDGAEDSLSAYRDRVVLIDFWATWCRPCIDVLPELRALVAELPADRFTLLAISVDERLETVTALREREPMPWTNWHAGIDSDIERAWDVRGFPTYVLVDEQGLILARTSGFDDSVHRTRQGRGRGPRRTAGPARRRRRQRARRGRAPARGRRGQDARRGRAPTRRRAGPSGSAIPARRAVPERHRRSGGRRRGRRLVPARRRPGSRQRAVRARVRVRQRGGRSSPTTPSPATGSGARPSRDTTPRSGCSARSTPSDAPAYRGTTSRRTCGCIWPCRRTTSTTRACSRCWRRG